MGQALYRKYRSRSLEELVGQEHITTTLSNAIKSGKISHAYLFTGPKGVGKTSVARILAHIVNELPYSEDRLHLDIIEIDAASNRRIDEIRDLREKVNISPSSAKYKVYIIDEVHMLTKEAFNALLKTLEEPPEHVIFILATTEAHKLPETIISRTQRFNFKPIQDSVAEKHLKNIAKAEKIKIDDEAIRQIVQHGEGSFRDSISLLDQISGSAKHIKLDDVQSVLGIAPLMAISELDKLTSTGSANDLLEHLKSMRLKGYHAPTIAKQLSAFYRQKIVTDNNVNAEMLELLKNLINVPVSLEPEETLELVLLEQQMKLHSAKTLSPAVNTTTTSIAQVPLKKTLKVNDKNIVESPNNDINNAQRQSWTEIMNNIKSQHTTLYGTLRMADAVFNDKNTLTLRFNFAFHKKRLDEKKNLEILKKTAKSVLGRDIDINCLVQGKEKKDINNLATPGELETISNIFGSAERL